jgi:hypothetical protein
MLDVGCELGIKEDGPPRLLTTVYFWTAREYMFANASVLKLRYRCYEIRITRLKLPREAVTATGEGIRSE